MNVIVNTPTQFLRYGIKLVYAANPTFLNLIGWVGMLFVSFFTPLWREILRGDFLAAIIVFLIIAMPFLFWEDFF